MKRSFFAILSIASMLAGAGSFALAQERVQAGTLVCHTSIELGVILGSQEALSCTFTPSVPAPIQAYSGTITKLGLDLGAASRGVIVWLVYAPTSLRGASSPAPMWGRRRRRPLARASAPIFWSADRAKRSRFRPVSIQGQVGLNLAVGLAELRLHFVR